MTVKSNTAALVGSRICHDLISPIGAIGNGLELLQMSAPAATPEMALIQESLRNANARIKFFRIAFGAANSDQILPRQETQTILRDVSQGARVEIDWTVVIDAPRPAVRLTFLLTQCMETCLPQGGRITISETDGGWRLEASGPDIRHDSPYLSVLSDAVPEADITPSKVHFQLAREAAAAMDRQIFVEAGDGNLALTF